MIKTDFSKMHRRTLTSAEVSTSPPGTFFIDQEDHLYVRVPAFAKGVGAICRVLASGFDEMIAPSEIIGTRVTDDGERLALFRIDITIVIDSVAR